MILSDVMNMNQDKDRIKQIGEVLKEMDALKKRYEDTNSFTKKKKKRNINKSKNQDKSMRGVSFEIQYEKLRERLNALLDGGE